MRFKDLLEQHQSGIQEEGFGGLEGFELLMSGVQVSNSNPADRSQVCELHQQPAQLDTEIPSQTQGPSMQWNYSQNFLMNLGGSSVSQLWPATGLGLIKTDSRVSRRNSRIQARNSTQPTDLNFFMQSRMNSREGGIPITRQNSILDCLRQLERFNSIANLNQGQDAVNRVDAFQFLDSRKVSGSCNQQMFGFGQQAEDRLKSRMPSFRSPIKPTQVFVDEQIPKKKSVEVRNPQNPTRASKLQERRKILSCLRKQPSKQVIVRIETKKRLQKEVERQYVQCVCKKTKCLKLYCICFKNGITCSDLCDCAGCLNTGTGITPSESVSSHRAFRQKVLHKLKGRKDHPDQDCCNCRKSFCQNHYCKCFRNGRVCGNQCTCLACKNKMQ
jgi:Tesmin/TSO1-like CXC domain, cysteine-rich domain